MGNVYASLREHTSSCFSTRDAKPPTPPRPASPHKTDKVSVLVPLSPVVSFRENGVLRVSTDGEGLEPKRKGSVLRGQEDVLETNKHWHDSAFPRYLQSEKDDFCEEWDEALRVSPLQFP